MKTSLLLCFLSISFLASAQRDRGVIRNIDDLNFSALKHYKNNQIAKSFNEFSRSKVLSDSIQDNYGSAVSNYNLGNIYNSMQNEQSAKDCYHLALESSKKIQEQYLLLNIAIEPSINPNFTEQEFEKEKSKLITALKSQERDVSAIAGYVSEPGWRPD